ncbi:MAG: hypothetical protein AAGD04_15025, partial [Pseudomonadota bacterium]
MQGHETPLKFKASPQTPLSALKSLGFLFLTSLLSVLGFGFSSTSSAQQTGSYLAGVEHAQYVQHSKAELSRNQARELRRFREEALYHAAFYYIPNTGVAAWYMTMHTTTDARRAAQRLCEAQGSLGGASRSSASALAARGLKTYGKGRRCKLYAEMLPIQMSALDSGERRLSATAEEARHMIRANTRLGRFGAIAASRSGIFGTTWDFGSKQAANSEAMEQCRLGAAEEQFEMDYLSARALDEDGWFTCRIVFQ